MKPSRILEAVEQLIETRWPVFMWGPPGVGKSSIVKQVAERRKVPLIDIRAALLDPTDIRGIPAIENGKAIWCPPSFLPGPDQPAGILFFDELSSAPPLVQASLYQLTLDRRVGEYRLPDGWRIIAAGNRAEDRSISFRMPAALANRFIHLDFEIDYSDWRDWAVRHGIHPLVIAFLGIRRELMHDMRQPERGFPTPRSWEMVSDALALNAAHGSRKGKDPQAASIENLFDILTGIIGEPATIEFVAFCREAFSEETFLRLIADAQNAPLPRKLGDIYALVSYLVSRGKEKSVQQAAGILLNRLQPELAALLMNDLLKVAPVFAANPMVREFMGKNAGYIAP